MGGKLQAFFPVWKEATTSTFVLNLIRQGYDLEFSQIPPHCLYITNLQKDKEKALAMTSLFEGDDADIIQVPKEQEGEGYLPRYFWSRNLWGNSA